MRKSVKMLNLDGGLFQVVCTNNERVDISNIVGWGKIEKYSTQDAMFIEFFKHTQKCIEEKQKEIYELQNKIGKIGRIM
ncbi:hypothetical protein Barba22A_gp057 [Rheinheimera phage vB_RspM_Barba22A]|jgi:hypothetical protein|uniref:Uncharacterized protein n=72 Tax=Barbavirus barba18A TaxID=2734090 RepID=A0A7G9VRT7_9CAUD|nr:hypothetical protein HOV46_gp057 [Rheinheimera phage vB_RspM_Barba18A]QCQ57908.1 hypothetical protein Barba1A_gp057 [Rheinheimera phage vB_RspM_Barba1A]QCQ58044.1 hypothetical protein Barba1S_gp057 [Rheinheimera phage vB_RspM_Barba1S]QCQ58180.1 hypothetical protein Barba2A_gp057 [Rheinheimera phage vB_RspM_Barba2A]QCQ58316.1 hypothetical protein Barba2S_gp057 [Rheinheimera phage vB_RspM_Barba2S]QCQ58590.1 hypothetical protein Barba3S_gp057 [Rheinheimera phage vB_RspM_Barba3S]QCQ58726.1 hyp